LAAGLGPDPLGELMCFPGPLAAMGVPTYRGRERRGRRGLLNKEDGWERMERGDGKEIPQSQGE